MPARCVAGSKAERFFHKLWALLGEAAQGALKEDDFARDKGGAGALDAVFSVTPRVQDGRIERVDLVVTQHFYGGAASTQTTPFKGPDGLAIFLRTLDHACRNDRTQFPWEEYDLSIDGDSTVQLDRGRQVEHLWRTQPAAKISFE